MNDRQPLDISAAASTGRTAVRPAAHWADIGPDDRREAVRSEGLPGFRADQLSRHYYGHDSASPTEWSDLSASLARQVADRWFPELLHVQQVQSCDDGTTRKHLWRLTGGALVETVVMGYPDRATACISSQAGCGMGCPFCATGQGGLTRNLSTGEIVEQVRQARRVAARRNLGKGHLSNIVLMGMGEPLANYRAVVAALHRMIDPVPRGFGMSARNVTLSTVGLVPRIRQLADEGMPVTLAVSLHAPDDELRDTLVPINIRWPVAEVLAAADHYTRVTGRRYSIEYALIRDINDQAWRARALADLLAPRLAHVNLIPLNPTPGSVWTASRERDSDAFVDALRSGGVSVTMRDTRGQEIDGACGQLAATVG